MTLRLNQQLFFPRFQFTQVAPELDPVLMTIVRALLEGGMSGWQIVFWLTAANTYLQGRRPLDCLKQVPRLLPAIGRRPVSVADDGKPLSCPAMDATKAQHHPLPSICMVESPEEQGEFPTVEVHSDSQGRQTLALSGDWTLRSLARMAQDMTQRLRSHAEQPDLRWNLEGISGLDSVGAYLIWQACDGQGLSQMQARPEHQRLLQRWASRQVNLDAARPAPKPSVLQRLSIFGYDATNHVRTLLELTGQMGLDSLTLFRNPSQIPWKDISATVYQAGVRALGITALVGFLIGIVVSYLSSLQLRTFGAQVYIINILGISIIRELGPLLAAILVAGRSGSAMTAQLGVMRVTEELDALKAMGISQSIRLVLPKVVALILALPLLVIWTDALALVGGMLSARAALGISLLRFIERLPHVVPVANLWIGLGKSAVFGGVIALIACHFGLRIKPNTESLGIETTNAVVTAITLVILVDAIFAIVFRGVGVA